MPNSRTYTDPDDLKRAAGEPVSAARHDADTENIAYLHEALSGIMDPANPENGLNEDVDTQPDVLVVETVNNNPTSPSGGFPDQIKMGMWKSESNGYSYLMFWDQDEDTPTRDNAVAALRYETDLDWVPTT